MRVAVVGATGNIGFHLVRALVTRHDVDEVVALARRLPSDRVDPRVRWHSVDVAAPASTAELAELFAGCDAVVHLAWLIQPEREVELLTATNVEGSARVFAAVVAAGVPALVYASSVGSYSSGLDASGGKTRAVAESWPTNGVPGSLYSQQKVAVERALDTFEHEWPQVRVVRVRPAFVLSGAAAASQVRYFIGPLLPRRLLRSGRLPLVPRIAGLELQLVHSEDAAAAFATAVTTPVRGAYNVAAPPVVGPATLPAILGGKPVPVPVWLVRAAVKVAYRLRLTPVSEGWIDLALRVPLMDTTRALRNLDWHPHHYADAALLEWLRGAARGTGRPTPVLRPAPRWVDQVRGGVRALTRGNSGRI